MDNILQGGRRTRLSKDNGKSEELRRAANYQFIKKNTSAYMNALHGYNESICFAENDSKQLALGYANRSAVYFEMKMYNECLANIVLARSVQGYPQNLNDNLVARESRCRALMAATVPDIDVVQPVLSYPPHKKIPFVANCVEIRRNGHYGRYLVTNRDLKVGDTISIETPFCTFLRGKHQYHRCEFCAEENSRNLIPCESCTAVMFCSVECRTEAMRSFHQYECPAIDVIKKVPSALFLPIHEVLCALALFDGDTKAMFEYATEADFNGDDTTIFDIDATCRSMALRKFAPIYCLFDAQKEKLDATATAIIMATLDLVLQSCGLGHDGVHLRKLVEHFSVRGLHSTRIFDTRSLYEDEAASEQSRVVYSVQPLFNHSCMPNVASSAYGNKSVATVARPIKAGETLFIVNACLFFTKTLEERIEIMDDMCQVRCNCMACKKDYALFADLPWSKIAIPPAINELRVRLKEEPPSRKIALESVPVLADHLQKIGENVAYKDSVILSLTFSECLMMMYEKENHAFLKNTKKTQ